MQIIKVEELKIPKIILAEPDDLEFIVKPHPNEPTRNSIWLHNKNEKSGIVATILNNSSSDLMIETLSRLTARRRWPSRFEVRIPPHSMVLLGFEKLRIWLLIDSATPEASPASEVVTQLYAVESPYYSDSPLPPINEIPEDYIWVFSVKIIHNDYYNWMEMLVNTHPNRVIEASLAPSSSAHFSTSLIPGSSVQVAFGKDKQKFRIDSIKFV